VLVAAAAAAGALAVELFGVAAVAAVAVVLLLRASPDASVLSLNARPEGRSLRRSAGGARLHVHIRLQRCDLAHRVP
jgi:hypothetical protein